MRLLVDVKEPMEPRKLKQSGWISGPVECRCSACDWSSNFIAEDLSIPLELLDAFQNHDCSEFERPVHTLNQYQRGSYSYERKTS